MKKILLFIVALVATLSMNAQTTEIHNASGKVAAYLGADVTVKFGVAGDGQPTLEVYKGGELQKTYTGSEYKVVSTPVEETFKAVYDTNGGANTLTFYYDANDHSGNGITVYDNLPTAATMAADWGYDSIRADVKEVVIDASVKNYSSLTSTVYMFKGMATATNISGAEYLDVSNVTNMAYMFSNFGGGKSDSPTTLNVVPDVSKWNTSNVTNMYAMFESYGNFSSSLDKVPDVSDWNTGKVTDMSSMFQKYGYGSQTFNAVPDVSKWNTGNVTSMNQMFFGYGFKSTALNAVPDVSKWNTGNVTNMFQMFISYGNSSTALNTVPNVSNWNTDNVTNMTNMFYGYGHTSTNISCVLDLSGWDLSNVTSGEGVFGFKQIKTFSVTIPGKTGDKVNDASHWYYGDGSKSIAPPSGMSFTIFGQGYAAVKAEAGVSDNKVKWVQLWEDGPKFAVCNVGVTDGKAESYGDYFTWANNIAGSKWGSSWRMPTKEDFQALLDSCTREPIENYNGTGVNGVKFTGKGDFSGNSIFLPAAGIDINGVSGKGQYEYYWSSTPDDSDDGKAYAIGYNNYSMGFSVNVSDRTYGFSVRAVYQGPTTGTAKRTGNIDVNWVQLWKDGPKFAEYNVGVTDGKAESYGGYYAWGGSQDKVDDHNTTNTGSGNLTGTDDTATNLWGDNWRMPTQTELEVLLANCDVELTTVGGVNGHKFTGKGDYASNSVFLPAAGSYYGGNVRGQGDYGLYWSSTPYSSYYAYDLYISSSQYVENSRRDNGYGYSVRAVVKDPVAVTGVSLNKTTLELGVGASETLTPTFIPADADNKNVSWASDNESVATVDANGKVTAVAIGEATITVTTEDGNKTATCKVAVSPAAEPEYVEIGGLKWATMNLGAEKETDYGDHFAWGETAPYYEGTGGWPATPTWKSEKASGYAWQSYCGSSSFSEWSIPPYDDTTKILKPEFDAAAQILGNGWRMPTSAEFKALYDACGGTETPKTGGSTSTTEKGVYWCDNYDGVKGLLFCDGTNKLFFPAAGYGAGIGHNSAGPQCRYWSSSLYTNNSRAYYLSFSSSDGVNPQKDFTRYSGFSVRPVKDAAAPLPAGALKGEFSVSATKKVHFSKGNLYWDGDSYEFEENQYAIDTWNAENHVNYFFWSKEESVAGAASYADASAAASDVFFTNATAETAKADFTVSGVTGKFRALSAEEWTYILSNRANAADLLVEDVTVCDVEHCLVIAPDACLNSYVFDKTKKSYDAAAWATAEAAGLVCLPPAGYRDGTDVKSGEGNGFYWSSTTDAADKASNLGFKKSDN